MLVVLLRLRGGYHGVGYDRPAPYRPGEDERRSSPGRDRTHHRHLVHGVRRRLRLGARKTVAALGRLLHPELVKARYSEKFSLGLIASSAECALLIPPSITLIIYGWLTGTSIADLFAAGFVVGVVLGIAFMIQVQIVTVRTGAGASQRATGKERFLALRDALVALGLPGIILGGIYSGVFTATEAAAVAVIYALTVEVLIYRSFGIRALMEVAESSAITVAVIFILLAMGSLLSFFITLAQVPFFFTQLFTDWNDQGSLEHWRPRCIAASCH